MDGEAQERLLKKGLQLDQAELDAAKPHWAILQDMAAVLLDDEPPKQQPANDQPLKGDDENLNP
ncbi:MAG: hypothetical protein AAF607_05595 [Pseudomonadota bacterium]